MATVDSLPPAVRSLLAANLRPGETVRWAAQPDLERAWAAPAARRRRIALRVILWLVGLITLFMVLAGGPIIGGETLLLAGPAMWLLLRAIRRQREHLLVSASVVTDQRALNLRASRWSRVESFEPAQLAHLSCREETGGVGSIIFFTTSHEVQGDEYRRSVTVEHGFFHIPEVRQAEHHLRNIAPPPLPT